MKKIHFLKIASGVTHLNKSAFGIEDFFFLKFYQGYKKIILLINVARLFTFFLFVLIILALKYFIIIIIMVFDSLILGCFNSK